MHLEQAILAGLRMLVPDLDGLTACKTGALRCSAPRGQQSIGLHLQAADRTRGYLAVCLGRYTDTGKCAIADSQMEIEIKLKAGAARALWWGESSHRAAGAGATEQAALNDALADWIGRLNAAGVRLMPAAEETAQ